MINKRLNNDDDKATLAQFKADIFNHSSPSATTIKKYFKMVSEVETIQNIA